MPWKECSRAEGKCLSGSRAACYRAGPRTHSACPEVLQPLPAPIFRLPELKQKLQTSPLLFVDPLSTQGSLNSIGPLILFCRDSFESKRASNSSIVGRRQSEFPSDRKLLQYPAAWLGLTEEPLSLTAHVNPVALSFQELLLSAPAAGFESWPITAQVPTHRTVSVSRNLIILSSLLFQSIKLILSHALKRPAFAFDASAIQYL